jgi:hypothetical protein
MILIGYQASEIVQLTSLVPGPLIRMTRYAANPDVARSSVHG